MDSSDVTQLIILFILLLLSGFFSSAETALTTVNKIRMRFLAEEGNKRAETVLKITENSGKMLSAILIGNNIVNISASSLTTTLAYGLAGPAVAVATGVLTVLILLFGEITPKTMATLHAEKMSLLYAPVIHIFMKLMTPAIFIINNLTKNFYENQTIKAECSFCRRTSAERNGCHCWRKKLHLLLLLVWAGWLTKWNKHVCQLWNWRLFKPGM